MYYIVDNLSAVKKFERNYTKKPMVIWFYATWCGHCNDMEPAWDEYVNNSKNMKVDVAKINSDYIKYLKKEPEIQGFPSIEFHNKGNKTAEFKNNRTPEELLNFTKNNLKLIKSKKTRKSSRKSNKPKSKKINKTKTKKRRRTI